MLPAASPVCITEVTRFTAQVPAKTAYTHEGTSGVYAAATELTAAHSAICRATSQRTSTRAPAGLPVPVTRAS